MRADVKKPLASPVEIAKAGNRIVLEADGGYIENTQTGEKDESRCGTKRVHVPGADGGW